MTINLDIYLTPDETKKIIYKYVDEQTEKIWKKTHTVKKDYLKTITVY